MPDIVHKQTNNGGTPVVPGGPDPRAQFMAGAIMSTQNLMEFSPQGATNIRFSVALKAAGVPQSLPAYHVPPGARVILGGYWNQNSNTSNIWVGKSPEELASGGRLLLSGNEIDFPVDNLGEVWVKGSILGDGVSVTIIVPVVG